MPICWRFRGKTAASFWRAVPRRLKFLSHRRSQLAVWWLLQTTDGPRGWHFNAADGEKRFGNMTCFAGLVGSCASAARLVGADV